jgi:glycosyltransferase involved in cell wall biosynthesis
VKILLISGIYPPDDGGPAKFVPQFAIHLISQGHQVKVITLTGTNRTKDEFPYPVKFIKRSLPRPVRMIITTLQIIKSSIRSDFVFSNGLYEETGIAIRLTRTPTLGKIVGDPVWERVRNSGKTALTIDSFNNEMTGGIQRKLLSFALNGFSGIITPSQQLADFVKNWGISNHVSVIPNGVQILGMTKQSKEFDLVTVSRLVPWKNVDLLIRIAANKNLKLCVIGDGPENSKLRSLAAELNAEITFTGALAQEKVSEQVVKAKYFALLSTYEGMSFALLEALGAGIPAIVSNAAGNVAVIENGVNGILVPPANVEAIAEAVIRLLTTDSELKLKLSENGKSRSQQFHAQVIASIYEKMFLRNSCIN